MVGDPSTNAKKILRRIRGILMSTEYWLTVIGLICFIEGLPYLAMPEQLKGWLKQLIRMPNSHLRLMGGALMVMGLIFVYWGRHHGG